MAAERRFRAMGTDVHLVVVGGTADLLVDAQQQIAVCERRWSRFRPGSELSAINGAAGLPTIVSPETFALLRRAIDAWWSTSGRFDPTVLEAVRRAGYDRTFAAVPSDGDGVPAAPPPAGCSGIELDEHLGSITLPFGVTLDLGGIAKGWTADRVVERLLATGAAGACVNLGGDVRVSGVGPDDRGWTIAVDDPFDPQRTAATVALSEGAVATSSRLKRCWHRGGEAQHHLIDPSTGRPSRSDVVAATVVGGTATDSEVLAKAALIAGADQGVALIEGAGAAGLLMTETGRPARTASFPRFETPLEGTQP